MVFWGVAGVVCALVDDSHASAEASECQSLFQSACLNDGDQLHRDTMFDWWCTEKGMVVLLRVLIA